MAAIVVAVLVDKGLLDYDAKVSNYWPEFGQNGKEDITLADVLRHESGLDYLEHSFNKYDLLRDNLKNNSIGKWIELEKPHWLPEARRAYHAVTRGFILNEIVRRVDPKGRLIGEVLYEEIQSTGIFCGMPDSELPKAVPLCAKSVMWVMMHSMLPSFVDDKVGFSIFELLTPKKEEKEFVTKICSVMDEFPADLVDFYKYFEEDTARRGEMPSVNFNATARGLAKLAAAMANNGRDPDGKTILSEECWEKMHAGARCEYDKHIGTWLYVLVYFICKGASTFLEVVEMNCPLKKGMSKF